MLSAGTDREEVVQIEGFGSVHFGTKQDLQSFAVTAMEEQVRRGSAPMPGKVTTLTAWNPMSLGEPMSQSTNGNATDVGSERNDTQEGRPLNPEISHRQ